jgi:pimeloyl-ACP methyl ester carboxylesterase
MVGINVRLPMLLWRGRDCLYNAVQCVPFVFHSSLTSPNVSYTPGDLAATHHEVRHWCCWVCCVGCVDFIHRGRGVEVAARMATDSDTRLPAVPARVPVDIPHVELGIPHGEPLVLMSGLPDDCLSGWDPAFLDKLKASYRIFAFCMPDYDKVKNYRPWGHDFDDIVDGLRAKLLRLLTPLPATATATVASGKAKGKQVVTATTQKLSFYLCAHDWGSTTAQYYVNKYPDDVRKLILLDVSKLLCCICSTEITILVFETKVGQDVDARTPGIFTTFCYLLWFLAAYVVSQLIYERLGLLMMKIFSIFWRIGPVPYDTPARPSHEVNVHFLYPIYYYWIRLINHKVFKKRSLPTFPSCPVLFIYGKAISCSHDVSPVSI